MGVTVTIRKRSVEGNLKVRTGSLAFDSSYPTGGEAVTAADFGLNHLEHLDLGSEDGYMFMWDRANGKIKAYYPSGTPTLSNAGTGATGTNAFGGTTGAVADDDNAGTNGTALYAHLVESGRAILKSVNANNADSYFLVGTGGAVVVFDDDGAATGGFQVYFDEDASPEDARWLINNTLTGVDLFVETTDGELIRLVHDGSAATNGVAVYFDDDGASPAARLLFVSPSNSAGAYDTDDSYRGMQDSHTHTGPSHTHTATAETADEVADATDLSGVTAVPFTAKGW